MNNLLSSNLYDEKTFYDTFIHDLKRCKKEVIIESPFITTDRMKIFTPIIASLLKRGINVYIMTRDPKEHTEKMIEQAELAIQYFERLGVQVFICKGSHHRKLAIVDREILWEGSLNILSQAYSREIMRRIESHVLAKQMFDFIQYERLI